MFPRSLILKLALLSVAVIPCAYADSCTGLEIRSIPDRPVYPNRPDSPRFNYRYQMRRCGSASDPFVIFLPGGPGVASIGVDSAAPLILPPGLNAIYTDQRGSGYNADTTQAFAEDAFSTRIFADDVIAILRKENLSNYVLYGHSYGTVHATVTASLIAKEGLPPPKAVVLEGTVGRAFRPGEPLHGWQAEWNRAIDRQPDPVRSVMSGSVLPFPDIQDAATRWGDFIFNQIYVGRLPPNPTDPDLNFYLYFMNPSVSSDPANAEKLAYIRKAVAFSEGTDGRTFHIVGCREIFAGFPSDFSLVKGELNGIGDVCQGRKLIDAYDSKDWPIPSPVIYFQGTDDPATPTYQTDYHFSQNPSGPKTVVTIGEAGHMPLNENLRVAGCTPAIWRSILAGASDLKSALADCRWPWPITTSAR